MILLYKCTRVPSRYTSRPFFYMDPVVDDNGNIYTVFLLKRYLQSNKYSAYYPCIAFNSNTITSENFEWSDIGFNTSTFSGQQVLYEGNTSTVFEDKTGALRKSFASFRGFNTEKQIGFITIADFYNFQMHYPTDQSTYEFSFYLREIDYDSPDFWEKLEKIPKPKLAFEVDTSTEGGGDGEYNDDQSDTIGLPDLTALNQNSISNTKFLSRLSTGGTCI